MISRYGSASWRIDTERGDGEGVAVTLKLGRRHPVSSNDQNTTSYGVALCSEDRQQKTGSPVQYLFCEPSSLRHRRRPRQVGDLAKSAMPSPRCYAPPGQR